MPLLKLLEKDEIDISLSEVYETAEKMIGAVPPNMKLIANSPKMLLSLVSRNQDIMTHPNISQLFFPVLRLFISNKLGFNFCVIFNSQMMQAFGLDGKAIEAFKDNLDNAPLKEDEKELAKAAAKATLNPDDFCAEDIQRLRAFGWKDSDILDAIDHATTMLKMGTVLKALKL
ncbi:hypothetical protein DSN97_03605 [Deferribacteraceae bacterium V6Fe1]|nr:hypothetical protein DSN97_03605 [Deferribacteraceae bacterium V6Fe1]